MTEENELLKSHLEVQRLDFQEERLDRAKACGELDNTRTLLKSSEENVKRLTSELASAKTLVEKLKCHVQLLEDEKMAMGLQSSGDRGVPRSVAFRYGIDVPDSIECAADEHSQRKHRTSSADKINRDLLQSDVHVSRSQPCVSSTRTANCGGDNSLSRNDSFCLTEDCNLKSELSRDGSCLSKSHVVPSHCKHSYADDHSFYKQFGMMNGSL